MRNEFLAYRPWYGILPPEHERTIHLGDFGHFTNDGRFLKLGSMFESPETGETKQDTEQDGLIGISRPGAGTVQMSEEMVFDPFISRTTGWNRVHEDQIDGYFRR